MAITPDQRATLQLLLERGQTLRRSRDPARRRRGRGSRPRPRGADRARRRRPRSQRRTHRLPARPGRPDRTRGRLAPPARGSRRPRARRRARRAPARDVSGRGAAPAARRAAQPGAAARRERRRPRRGEPEGPARGARLASRPSQTRLIVVLGSAAVLLIAVVLAITGAFGGDDDDPRRPRRRPRPRRGASRRGRIQRVALRADIGRRCEPARRCSASLPATSRSSRSRSTASIRAPQGQQYVIWLMLTRTQGYPLSPITVSQQGAYSNRFPIPSAVLAGRRPGALRRRLDRAREARSAESSALPSRTAAWCSRSRAGPSCAAPSRRRGRPVER